MKKLREVAYKEVALDKYKAVDGGDDVCINQHYNIAIFGVAFCQFASFELTDDAGEYYTRPSSHFLLRRTKSKTI